MNAKISKPPSLLDIFLTLPDSLKQVLAGVKSPLILGLMALKIAKDKGSKNWMSAEHIVAALEAAGVAVKRNQILRAFSRAGTKVSRKIIDEELHYSIMTLGCNEVLPLLGAGELQVCCVEAGMPRTARKMLSELVSDLKGEICICDPYYGVRSLDVLEMIDKNCKVKFLTEKTNENASKLRSAISDFRREYRNTEIKLYPKQKQLHDRYIVCSDCLLILGHGIKDIGARESFVIKIDAKYASDLIFGIRDSFNEKWNISSNLT